MKLNQSSIKLLEWSGKTLDIRWCDDLAGFGVRVYKTGRTCFVLGYTESGRYRIRTLSPCSQMSVVEAREEARSILRRSAGRSKLRKEFGPPVTFGALTNQWIENYAKHHRLSWQKEAKRLEKYVLPAIGNDSLSRIETLQLIKLHSEISAHAPVQANRVLELVRAIFNSAKRWGLWSGVNPAEAIKMNREHPRERWVTPEEMPRLLKAILEEKNLYAQKAMLLYLLTGCRKSEILKLKWSDIDLGRKQLIIRKTKTQRTYFISLSSFALEVLESIPRKENNPYVICGHREGSLVNITKPWYRVRARANINDVRIHDLRHTFASWLAQENHSLLFVGKALNHQSSQSTSRYAHLQQSAVAQIVQNHGEKLEKLFSLIKSSA